jgi:4-hydroxy-tetrahydrodipicolinate reductase
MRLLLLGDGKMGRAIDALARERGHDVVGMLGEADMTDPAATLAEYSGRADVAIEFTQPTAALGNVLGCLAAGLAVVTGTTGWYASLPVAEAEARRAGGALFWAPNFSVGVALTQELVRRAGELFAGQDQFDVHLVETHHRAKVDAPSGTAAALGKAASQALGRDVPITSIRVGHVPGTHRLVLDGPFEQITITHEARDRRVFADGALHAAGWLRGRQGVFSMRDLLSREEAP